MSRMCAPADHWSRCRTHIFSIRHPARFPLVEATTRLQKRNHPNESKKESGRPIHHNPSLAIHDISVNHSECHHRGKLADSILRLRNLATIEEKERASGAAVLLRREAGRRLHSHPRRRGRSLPQQLHPVKFPITCKAMCPPLSGTLEITTIAVKVPATP